MEIDEEEIVKLASKIDSGAAESLALLFVQMLDEGHTARHQSRPRLVKRFTEIIDDEQGVN